MAKRSRQNLEICLEPIFDRYLEKKLEQAYGVLVPNQSRSVGKTCTLKEEDNEDSSNLQPSFIRQAKG